MNIRWTAQGGLVPLLERVVGTGDEFDADEEVARRLIKNGLAEEVKTKAVKSKTEENDE